MFAWGGVQALFSCSKMGLTLTSSHSPHQYPLPIFLVAAVVPRTQEGQAWSSSLGCYREVFDPVGYQLGIWGHFSLSL